MTKRFLVFLAASLLVAVAPAGFAATVSHGTSTPIGPLSTEWTSQTLAFQQFDASLGTLTSVKLELDGSINTTITVENQSLEVSTGSAKTQVEMFVTGGSLNLPSPTIDMMSPSFIFTNLAPQEMATSSLLCKSGSFSDTYMDSGVLATFTGLSSVILNASTVTTTWISYTGGNAIAEQVTDACLTGTVTYTYEPIPEPITVALFGLGGLLLARKRKHC